MYTCSYDCECSICLENMDDTCDTTTLICNHKFHTKCIKEWTKIKNICPYCRKYLSNSYKASFKLYKINFPCEIFINQNDIKINVFFFNSCFKKIILKKNKIKSMSVINKTLLLVYNRNQKDLINYIKFKDQDITYLLFNHIQNFFKNNN